MLRRYENYWLPLVADAMKFDALLNSNAKGAKSLVPPLDVQWIWLCHCLNPVSERRFSHRCLHLSLSGSLEAEICETLYKR